MRIAHLLLAGALLALAAVLTLAAGPGRAGPTQSPSVAASSTPSATATGTDPGREVFLRDCAWCHGTDGSGTHNGPSLTGVGESAADFYLRTGRMPLSSPDADVKAHAPAYDAKTIDALVRFIGGLGAGPAIPQVAPGDLANGRVLYAENCAACHSGSGTGTIVSGGQQAPDLWTTQDQQVAEAIRLGPGPMPHFDTAQLSDQDVDDIVSYVHQLGARQRIGGLGLDQYGPILEGVVALLVLVPLLIVVTRLLGKRAGTRR
jgi:ubiquinol-cytochrome c reductase cytochrome c subunit